jgi:hypothetical protein
MDDVVVGINAEHSPDTITIGCADSHGFSPWYG